MQTRRILLTSGLFGVAVRAGAPAGSSRSPITTQWRNPPAADPYAVNPTAIGFKPDSV